MLESKKPACHHNLRASLGGQKRWCERCSHLHIHHIGIGLYQAVAHMQRGLKADL